MESQNSDRLTNRPTFSEKNISEKYSFNPSKTDGLWINTRKFVRKRYMPNKDCLRRFLIARLPIIEWIRKYSVRDNLLKDTIGGLTIGVVQIPQSMGYALMAGVPPVTGLYVAFFTVLVYLFLGTCRNLSLGTYGIVSLMVESAVDKFEGKLYPKVEHGSVVSTSTPVFSMASSTIQTVIRSLDEDGHLSNSSEHFLSNDPDEAKILIAMSLSFFVAIIQIGLSLIQAGVVTKYLSDIIVAGFTTGAAYHIVISQLNSLLGISVKHEHNLFKIVEYFIELFGNLNLINWPTVIVSIISMFELYMVKHFINQRYKDKMIAPFPIELLIITLGTLFSYLFRFKENFKINVVGNIPIGIPAPRVPPLWLFRDIAFESIEIAIVSFALNISMAKLFAKRYSYQVKPNQELFAYGTGNLISCFFSGFPSCVGLSRSVILESTGAKTLLNSAISSVVVLIVIVAIGFIFKTLPIACLSSIIVIALIPMLTEVRQIVTIFKRSKVDALAWLATFLGVMILDVDFGLYIGIVFSLLLFVIQNQRARTFVMGNIPQTDIYEAINECEDAREIDGIKIIRYESSIFYANVENFTRNVIKLAGANPEEIDAKINKKRDEYLKKINKINKKRCNLKNLFRGQNQNLTDSPTNVDLSRPIGREQTTAQLIPSQITSHEANLLQQAKEELDSDIERILNTIQLKDLIIDFSCVNLIDTMGVEAIANLIEAYKKLGIQIHLSHCKRYVIRVFKKSSLADKIDADFIYPTNHDAVLNILKFRETLKRSQKVTIISELGISQLTASTTNTASSLSLQIDKDKYEKLEGAEASGLSSRMYVKKKDDYDIINEIVSAI